MTRNRRVLMIAYHFPPIGESSGIQRTLKFATYLPEHGWEPLVLTISPRAYERVNPEQLREIPADMVVARAFGLDTARHLAVRGRYARWMAQPDRWLSWLPGALVQGMSLVRRYRPAAILSTFPIATAHLIGLALRRATDLPWIADFRDSMTEPDYPRDPLTWRTLRRLEQATVRRCARAIFTTRGALAMYAQRYPEVAANHWALIENGFDEDNFRVAEQTVDARADNEPLTLVHSGVLYPQERDPLPFFRAPQRLARGGEIDGSNLRVVLRATGSDSLYRPIIEQLGIGSIVQLAPPVGYSQALREMLRADGVLLFQAANCNHQIPAKLYEYLRAGRPIFALTDARGDTAAALRAATVRDIVDIADTEAIVGALQQFLTTLRRGAARGVPREIADRHSRRARTAELARLLDETTGSAP
jgi:hypothetical protein